MFLKKIELYGFKSFPNKKEILLNGGITGIVGPNGSGKSNIADALRWVLGEQSSKALRGSAMRDVIFNGTQTKPKKGFCEVSLTFDNSANTLNSEYTEICVKRKMYRTGESEYSINNAPCRLKDILDFFRDTGIGKEGYSIIGQGKIDEILDNKPLHRRRVFEEAAGISKFRVRKEEAENNLQKTRANLVRIEDILSELNLQLGPLESQMTDAKKYIDITNKLKILETNLWLYNYDSAQEKINENREKIESYEKDIADITEQQRECIDSIDNIKKELDELQKTLDAKNRSLTASLQESERLKGDRALIEERLTLAKKTIQENYDKLVSHNESLKYKLQEKENCSNEISKIELDIMYFNKELKIYAEQNAGVKLAQDLASEIEKFESDIRAISLEINSLNIKINEKEVELNYLKDSEADYKQKIQEKYSILKKEKDKEQSAEKSIQDIEDNKEQVIKELDLLKEYIKLSVKAKEENLEKLNITKSELDKTSTRLQLLKDMADKREGYYESVKKLILKSTNNTDIKSRIIGTVADLITVPAKYEVAVEVALGNALQNIIVKSDTDAKIIIEYLRQNSIGRITFLPADNLKIRTLSGFEQSQMNIRGILGLASDVIECDDKAKKAIDFLLGRTVLAQDLDSAIKFAKKCNYSLKVVTLLGDIISTGGPVTGGSVKKKTVGLLTRNRVIDELKIQIGELKTTYNLYKEESICRRKDHEELISQKELKEKQIGDFQLKIVALRQQFLSIGANIERTQKDIDNLKIDLDNCNSSHSNLDKEIQILKRDINKKQQKSNEYKNKLEILHDNYKAEEDKSQKNREYIEKLNENITELNHKSELKKLELSHLLTSINSIENSMREIEKQNEKTSEDITLYENKNRDIIYAIISLEKNNIAVNEETSKILDDRKAKQNILQQTEKRSESLNSDLNGLIERKYKLISATEKAETAKENAQNKLWDTYSLTYNNALMLKSDDFHYENTQKECEEIKSEIRKIGTVNPNAIEDYNRVRERYDNINAQKEDLIKAAEDLKIVISDLMDNMARCFKAKFEQIDISFRKVFSELFGGGTAALKLQNSNNIMECGIEIAAEPPGKKLQNISLLSGGEKALTAIALLFAMLKINPSPVCLLDEIDAPLDDANLIRFSEYLKKLAEKDNQFILITHRKPTMSACNTLYGVAMHEKGVSDLVSVKISG